MSNLFPTSPQSKEGFAKKLQQNPKNTAVYFGVALVLFFLIAASLAPQLNKGLGLLTQRKANQQSFANVEIGNTRLETTAAGFTSLFDSSGSGNDEARDLALDAEGNIYLTGSFASGQTSGSDIFIRKYSRAGEVIWTQTYANPENIVDENQAAEQGTAIRSEDQSIFVAGYTTKSASKKDILLAKYSNDGQLIWKKEFNMPSNDNDVASDLGKDSLGNIYLIGTQTQPKVGSDVLILKLDRMGNLLWARNFTTSAKNQGKTWPGNDIGSSVAVSNSGEIYAAGSMDFATEAQSQRIWLAKLDTNGKLLWEKTLDEGQAASLALNTQNQLLLAGRVFAKEPNGDKYGNALIAKFDTEGKEIAKEIFDTSNNGEESIGDIAFDLENNIYATGVQNREGQKQIFARIYNSELTLEKDQTVAIDGESKTPQAVARSQNGDLLIAGSTTTSTKSDFFLTKISAF